MSSPRLLIVTCLVVFLLATTGLAAWFFGSSPTLDEMKQIVRKRFPEVPQLSTAALAEWLNDSKRPKPVLLDTRTAKEYAVSHLHGAIQVDPSAKAEEILAKVPPGRPIVAYCSVGYRSSEVAERLKKAGVPQVYDLEGSIFQWANEGRPLEADGHSATKVHPYNRKFGAMLDESKRAPL